MTVRTSGRRGQPLVVLAAVMVCWVGARAFIWRAEHGGSGVVPHAEALSLPPAPPGSRERPRSSVLPQGPAAALAESGWAWARPRAAAGRVRDRPVAPLLPPAPGSRQAMLGLGLGLGLGLEPGVVGSQQPRSLTAQGATPPAAPPPSFLAPFTPTPVAQVPPAQRRWSADAWTLLRRGGGAASAGPSVATYGASQVGAVLRNRLWPGNAHRLTSYVRVSAALNGSGEREAALGLSVRPLGALPVFVAGEGRVSHLSGRTVVRPAVMAVTELPPLALPEGGRAEFYVQGGYVGGLGATPFIDGQLRVDRKVAGVGPVEVRAGGGAWGGAQRGAGRLDLGPAVTLQVSHGPAAMRLGLDWRFRLMGDAAPASGPALTISAGF